MLRAYLVAGGIDATLKRLDAARQKLGRAGVFVGEEILRCGIPEQTLETLRIVRETRDRVIVVTDSAGVDQLCGVEGEDVGKLRFLSPENALRVRTAEDAWEMANFVVAQEEEKDDKVEEEESGDEHAAQGGGKRVEDDKVGFEGRSEDWMDMLESWKLEAGGWRNPEGVLGSSGTVFGRRTSGWVGREKVMAFDVDGTLSVDMEDATRAARSAERVRLRPRAKEVVQELVEAGWCVVLCSNQGGLAQGRAKLEEVQSVMDRVVELLETDVLVLFAPRYDVFRKPSAGMWLATLSVLKGDGVGKVEKACFCGDMASDREFAGAARLGFVEVETALSSKISGLGAIDAASVEPFPMTPGLRMVVAAARGEPTYRLLHREGEDEKDVVGDLSELRSWTGLVVLVGPPGAGKSAAAGMLLPQMVRVNQDTLQSRDRCLKVAKQLLESGQSVVVDATNRDASTRMLWTNLASSLSVPVRAICLRASLSLALHQAGARVAKLSTHTISFPTHPTDAIYADKQYQTVPRPIEPPRAVGERIIRGWFLSATWPSATPDDPVHEAAQSLLPSTEPKSQPTLTSFFGAAPKSTSPPSKAGSKRSRSSTISGISDLHSSSYSRKTGPDVLVTPSKKKEGFQSILHIGVSAATISETESIRTSNNLSQIFQDAARNSPLFSSPLHAALFAAPNSIK